MLGKFEAHNYKDLAENPTGGGVEGVGLSIRWQDGPLGRGDARQEPNGAFVENRDCGGKTAYRVLYESKFKCRENSMAITKLDEALMWLNKRTVDEKTGR